MNINLMCGAVVHTSSCTCFNLIIHKLKLFVILRVHLLVTLEVGGTVEYCCFQTSRQTVSGLHFFTLHTNMRLILIFPSWRESKLLL